MLRFTTLLCATLLIAAPTYAATGGCMRDRETAEIVPQVVTDGVTPAALTGSGGS